MRTITTIPHNNTGLFGEYAPIIRPGSRSMRQQASRPLPRNNTYPGFPHAAADVLAYHRCADYYIILLSTDKALRYQPAIPAVFEQWLQECHITVIAHELAVRIEERLLNPKVHVA